VALELDPLSLVSTIEELLGRKSNGSGPKEEITAAGDRLTDHKTPLCPQKLALTSSTIGGRLVGIVRTRIQVTEFVFSLIVCPIFLTTVLLA
jgi:hypothetical protein